MAHQSPGHPRGAHTAVPSNSLAGHVLLHHLQSCKTEEREAAGSSREGPGRAGEVTGVAWRSPALPSPHVQEAAPRPLGCRSPRHCRRCCCVEGLSPRAPVLPCPTQTLPYRSRPTGGETPVWLRCLCSSQLILGLKKEPLPRPDVAAPEHGCAVEVAWEGGPGWAPLLRPPSQQAQAVAVARHKTLHRHLVPHCCLHESTHLSPSTAPRTLLCTRAFTNRDGKQARDTVCNGVAESFAQTATGTLSLALGTLAHGSTPDSPGTGRGQAHAGCP